MGQDELAPIRLDPETLLKLSLAAEASDLTLEQLVNGLLMAAVVELDRETD
jgi:hypothetical protein